MITISMDEADALEYVSTLQVKSADYLDASMIAMRRGLPDQAKMLGTVAERWNRLALHVQSEILRQRGTRICKFAPGD